jgi:hypothetical protein
MKRFLDDTFDTFNENWTRYRSEVEAAENDFEAGVAELLKIFASDIARKPDSPQFNRAIFDALIFYHSQAEVRNALKSKRSTVRNAYEALFSAESGFSEAIESDTAGAPNTSARLRIWAATLSKIAGKTFKPPRIPVAADAASKPERPAARKRSKK